VEGGVVDPAKSTKILQN